MVFLYCIIFKGMEDEAEMIFHKAEDLSWGMVRQWFKAIHSKLVALKDIIGDELQHLKSLKEFFQDTWTTI